MPSVIGITGVAFAALGRRGMESIGDGISASAIPFCYVNLSHALGVSGKQGISAYVNDTWSERP